MSGESWKLEQDLCRCCHSEGAHKNLSEACIDGEDEILSDMLHDTLDITINPVTGPLGLVTYTICEPCMMRLQDAWSFKQQVVDCERRFHELYSRNALKMDPDNVIVVDVKQEVDLPIVVKTSPNEGVKEERLHSDDEDFLPVDDVQSDLSDQEQTKKKRKPRGRPKAPPKIKRTPRHAQNKTQKVDDSTADDGKEKKDGKAAKFRLNDGDYTRDGDIYQCGRCDKRYDKFFSLKFHVKTKHYHIARYPCPFCEEQFMTPAPLTKHKLKVHNVDDRISCNACKGIFNSKVQLRKHINNFHMMGERYKCESCDYESFSFEGMYKHKFKHKTVKDFHCRFCRKAFLRKTTLDLHERIHTGDRRKVCAVCSKAFVQKASLNYHMTKYHPEVNY
ncbi:zinc finger E-box-binding homeobox 2-like isoform X6 [Ostrinia nubilalis]|uniref:zinc finger E-box-binding homeobox 2-like isoform X6 n=1 Tax=Ostrinia nubilalis TaxID=29057 RepID=UPI003082520A